MTEVEFLKSCPELNSKRAPTPMRCRRAISSASCALSLSARDAVQLRLERLQTLGFDALLVHAGGIVVADLARDGVAIRRGLGGLLQDPRRTSRLRSASSEKRPQRDWSGGIGLFLIHVAAGVLVEVGAGVG